MMELQINHGVRQVSVTVNEDARQELPAGWNLSAAYTGATGPRSATARARTLTVFAHQNLRTAREEPKPWQSRCRFGHHCCVMNTRSLFSAIEADHEHSLGRSVASCQKAATGGR